MKHEKSCGAVVFRRMGETEQTLLIRHRNSNVWSFPKGHMEPGETELQTALREIGEETGVVQLHLYSGFRRTLEYFAKANVMKQVVFFVGETPEKEDLPRVRDDIVQEARWVDVTQVPDQLAFENHCVLFRDALAFWHENR